MKPYIAKPAKDYFSDAAWNDENTFNNPSVYLRLAVGGHGHDVITGMDAKQEMLEIIEHIQRLGYDITIFTTSIYPEK